MTGDPEASAAAPDVQAGLAAAGRALAADPTLVQAREARRALEALPAHPLPRPAQP